MFEKSDVDSYRQITAPPSLREKVMALSEAEKPVRYAPVRFAGMIAAAACLVLAAVSVMLWLPASDAVVSYNGSELTDEAVVITPDENQPAMALFSVRITPPVTVALSVEASEPTDISVSAGELMIYTADGEPAASGTDCSAAGQLYVEWTLTLAPGGSETITIGGREFIASQSDDGINTIREA